MEVPDQAKAAETERVEAPGRDLAVDRVNREEGDPEPGEDGLLDRLRVIEHEPRPVADAGGSQRPLGELARGGSGLAHEERLVGQALRGDRPPRRPSMARRDHEPQLVGEPRVQTRRPRTGLVAAHETQVQLARPDQPLDAFGVAEPQGELDARVLLAERAEQPGQHVDTGRGAGADREGSPLESLQILDRLAGVRQGHEEPRGVLGEHPAGIGKGHAAGEPVEEASPERGLELPHVLGERRLAQVQRLGRPVEAPGPRDREEDLELPERHDRGSLIGSI